MPFIEWRGQRLESLWTGTPRADGRALVFLHHGLGSVVTWRGFPDRLAQRTGLPAFNYSRLGHGRSDPATAARDLDYVHIEAHEVLPHVLAAAGIAAPIFVGHSDGATIALLYASLPRSPAVALVLEAPHVFVEDRTVAGIEAAVELYRRGGLRERLLRFHGANTDALFSAWAETWLMPSFRAWNCEDCLSRITCPVLVIQGEDDEYGSPAQLDRIKAQASGPVETVLLPRCAHEPHREHEETTLAIMARFIATGPAAH